MRFILRYSFFLAIFFIFVISPLKAREISLCHSDCLAKTLPEALALASFGDTILLQEGIYPTEGILINKSVSLKGEALGKVVLDGQNKKNVLHITSDNVTISNLVIRNSGSSEIEEFSGIRVENARNCNIHNNRIENTIYGIYLARVKNCHASANYIQTVAKNETFGGNGIHLWYSQFVQLNYNIITGHRDGLYFEFSENLAINHNLSFYNIRYGMHFMFCHHSVFHGNLFIGNYTGVAIMYSDKIKVKDNRFYGGKELTKIHSFLRTYQMKHRKSSDGVAIFSNALYSIPDKSKFIISSMGMLLKEVNESDFSFNLIQENAEGIIMDGNVKNEFRYNEFHGNGLAIKIYGNCQENNFINNNIIDNFFDITTNSKSNFNSFHKNYWSAYKGFDLNKDGFGDNLYRPVRVFSYWLIKYPEAIMLFASPMMRFLETMEVAFPILNPTTLYDKQPWLRPLKLKMLSKEKNI